MQSYGIIICFTACLLTTSAFDILGPEIQCLTKCAQQLVLQGAEEELCSKWEKAKLCTQECNVKITDLLPLVPKFVKDLLEDCDSKPTKGPEPLREGPLDGLQSILCARRCLQTVEEVRLDDAELSLSHVCSTFADVHSCFSQCANGEKLFSIVQQALPNAAKLVREGCSQPPSEGDTVSAKLLQELKDDQKTALELDQCAELCHKEVFTGFNKPSDFLQFCDTWSGFQDCIKSCPKGELIPKIVEQVAPAIMEKLETVCKKPSGGDIKELLSPADPSAGGKEIGKSALFEDALCARNCLEFMAYPDGEEDVSLGKLCDSVKATRRCLSSCKSGNAVLAFLKRVAPNLESVSDDVCIGVAGGSTEVLDPEKRKLLLLDRDVAAQVENCARTCYRQQFQKSVVNIPDGCNAWRAFKGCMNACPNGDSVLNLMQNIIPKITDTLSTVCEGKEIQDKCMGKSDTEASYCSKVAKSSQAKYGDERRFCQWKGFAKICAKTCCN